MPEAQFPRRTLLGSSLIKLVLCRQPIPLHKLLHRTEAHIRIRLEFTSEAESTLLEHIERLEAEFESQRPKGLWRKLFGG